MTVTKPQIAIVDDEESVRVALRRLCDAYGLSARAFGSVPQLVASLDAWRPDCLILDAQMPEFGGLDAQAMLRDGGIRIPAVMISGGDDDSIRARSLAAGASAWLRKPVDAEALLDAIKRAIGEP